jgi:DNA-3-methyladenine glycosylase II
MPPKGFQQINEHLVKDPVMNNIISKVQLDDIIQKQNLYRSLTQSIIHQQLSTKVAAIISKRFFDIFENENPEPQDVIVVNDEKLRSIGLSWQKVGYIKNIAKFWIDLQLENNHFIEKTDEEIIELLTQIKGVGKWTTEMLLIFEMGREDVFPHDDLAIKKQMATFYGLDFADKNLIQEMINIAEQWRPYRSAAVRYLWKSKDLNL